DALPILNKLFSTVNSAGVQLEQTDIVKANLLNLIDEKVKYGKIWEACENMNNFFERNVRLSFPSTDWNIVDFKKYYEFDGSIFRYESTNKNGINSDDTLIIIEDVNMNDISDYQHPTKNILGEKDRKSEEIYCRSIINFGQLLIHTYRLHLYIEGKEDFEGTFHVNRLIEIFNSLEARKDPNEIKRFFQLLWKVRYLFDKYVIKWITDIDNKTESLELVNFNKNDKGYYSRTKYAKSNSSMLQSVLYFTGDYLRQYWLTTYLGYLLKNHSDSDATNEIHLIKLEEFDNQFSLNDKLTDKDLSYLLLDKEATVDKTINIRTYLELNKGTAFKHYWFQKLEYILWKNWDSTINTQEYNNYRITSRNSVEHIYPQNPENQIQHPQIEDEYLHSFGNLVLLSVAQNSEYSNKSFRVKKSMFRDRRETYDTLKSYYIFQNDNWNKIEIIKHLETMISKIEEHYDAK
ncbi:MAG: HNH endonuclease, partial [Ignavibacteriae bacterium]|nr:HNH endonuclease [Ignavibacteriota bacterium]